MHPENDNKGCECPTGVCQRLRKSRSPLTGAEKQVTECGALTKTAISNGYVKV